MKLLIICILFTIIIQECISKKLFERLYVNMIPHQKEDCSDEISGIGYSGVIDTCLTMDKSSNFKFEISNHNEITWSTYKPRNGGSTTCNTNILLNNSAISGSCISSTTFNVDQEYQAMNKFYYEITISKTPFIPNNAWSDIYMASTDWNGCESDNIVVASYITNGTITEYAYSTSNDRMVYLCLNGEPFVQHCKVTKINPFYCYSPQNTTLSCYREISFYNGSSFEIPSGSGSTSGYYSGDNSNPTSTSNNSGTGAYSTGETSSGTASASSTTADLILNKNYETKSVGGGGGGGGQSSSSSSSSSEELINYFRSVQCFS